MYFMFAEQLMMDGGEPVSLELDESLLQTQMKRRKLLSLDCLSPAANSTMQKKRGYLLLIVIIDFNNSLIRTKRKSSLSPLGRICLKLRRAEAGGWEEVSSVEPIRLSRRADGEWEKTL